MLTAMRSKKTNVFGWLLMGMLIIGLAGFGLTDILSGGATNTIAKVGDREVTADTYYARFRTQQNAIARQIGSAIPAQDLINAGVDRQILQGLVNEAAWGAEADEMGLSLPDQQLRDAILQDPSFAGPGGEFSQFAYDEALRNSGQTAVAFEETLRNRYMREVVMALAIADISAAPQMSDFLVSYLAQKRSVTFIELPLENYVPEAEPTDEELRAYHAENSDDFMRPETRKISYIAFDPALIARNLEIDETRIREEYDARGEDYNRPETREVARLVYGSNAEAETDAAALNNGSKTLEDVASARGLTVEDVMIGSVSEASAPAAVDAGHIPAIMSAQTASEVVDTLFGPAIYVVTGKTEAEVTPFEEVRDALRFALAVRDVRDTELEDITLAEELIAGGASYDEIAAETRFEARETEISAEGGPGFEIMPSFIQEAFTAGVNEDRDLIETDSGRAFALRVNEIVDASVIPFDDIRDEVMTEWRLAKATEAAMADAETMKQRASEGRALSGMAAARGLSLDVHPELRRDEPSDLLPADVVAAMFEGDTGVIAIGENDNGVVVAQLADIIAFDLESQDGLQLVASFDSQMTTGLRREAADLMAGRIANREGLTINTAVLNAINAQIP